MRLYASNASISRSARRHARLNRPMGALETTPTRAMEARQEQKERRGLRVALRFHPQTAGS